MEVRPQQFIRAAAPGRLNASSIAAEGGLLGYITPGQSIDPGAARQSGFARQMAELHHGTIFVRNELGRGSEFAIQFHDQTQHLEELENP
jgi:hypothetical protein